MTLRILIADDEKMARKRLRRLVELLGHEIVAECCTGEEAVALLDPAHIDVAILDINMPKLDGMKTAKLARRRNVPVIFASAHEEHALRAFAQGAVHYLLKPLDVARLEEALSRIPAPEAMSRLTLTVRGEVRLVRPPDISHATFDGTLVSVFAKGEECLCEMSLQQLEDRLGDGFVRVHRRALVNFERVERLRPQPSGGYVAVLDSGAEVAVSRQSARALRKRLGLS